MYVEGSTGAMLQGVSQQPERLRVLGQVGEQINYDSVLSKGITSRPGTDLVGVFTGVSADTQFADIKVDGGEYIIGYESGTVKVWDTAGTAYTTSGPAGYFGSDMSFYSDDDSILCTNRNTVVEQDPTVIAVTVHSAVVTCLGGQFSRTYKVTVSGSFGTHSGSYETPDGTADGDALKSASEYIIAEIRTAMLVGLPAGMTLQIKGSTLAIGYTSAITVDIEDGSYGAELRGVDTTTEEVEDLPEFAQHGHLVLVQGSASADDDYYLQFVIEDGVIGTGFGTAGVWREAAAPGIPHAFALETMPHEITLDTTALTATVTQGDWLARRVGDENTNPTPSFVGSAIRDLAGFESRIVVAAGAKVVMTQSGEDGTRDFFKKSATTAVASDPIDIFSTKAKDATIDWIIPFDRNLLLVSDPGSAQFVITGGGITPTNASMVLSTDYTIDSNVRPVTTGRTALLPFTAGQYSGVNEFFTNDQVATNGADPITSGQDRYITGTINGMSAAVNFNQIALRASGSPDTIWVYQYLWSGTERLQSAWYQRKMPTNVRHLFYSGGNLVVLVDDPTGSTDVMLLRMDLNRVDDSVGFHITLDLKLDYTAVDNTVTTNMSSLRFVQREGCATPGQYAQVSEEVDNLDGTFTYYFNEDVVVDGATLTGGIAVPRSLVPTMPLYRDYKDQVVSKAKITISAFMIHMEASGDIKATFDSPYRASRDFYPRRFWLDDEALDPDRLGLEDYTLRVPWGEQTTRSTLTVSSDDVRPDTILEIEWSGDVRGARKRI